ncbi:MAG TPA: glycoside hydrolase family 3 N-terminal domain-containing protein [Terriglobia bacterium]|nr:glycoside hydrolase family 3 N-terminal domain-containing protein [Terriglobia bacterium]
MSSDQIGQLLAVRWEETRWGGVLERLLKRYQPAGVLLPLRRGDSVESMAAMLGCITGALSVPPFLWLDAERTIDRLSEPLPSPRAAAQAGPSAVERLADLIGQGLQLLGFNSYGGPTLDLVAPGIEGPFTDRAFSGNPETTAQCAATFLQQLDRHHILACPGSFPGLADSTGLRPDQPIVVDKPMATLWRDDLRPYREALSRLRMIRISFASYKAFDYEPPKPAPLSERVLEGLLRVRLGYRGAAVATLYTSGLGGQRLTPGQAAVRSINSGCDLLIVNGDTELAQAFSALEAGVKSGALSDDRVEQALSRVSRAKEGLALPTGKLSASEWDPFVNACEQFSSELRGGAQG